MASTVSTPQQLAEFPQWPATPTLSPWIPNSQPGWDTPNSIGGVFSEYDPAFSIQSASSVLTTTPVIHHGPRDTVATAATFADQGTVTEMSPFHAPIGFDTKGVRDIIRQRLFTLDEHFDNADDDDSGFCTPDPLVIINTPGAPKKVRRSDDENANRLCDAACMRV